jgi:alpha-tubulin suppressor-like RCC1 family protein
MVYVTDVNEYFFSDGVNWTDNFSSRPNIQIFSFGNNTNGRLGDGTTVAKCSPEQILVSFSDWCQVAAGSNHTAAVRTNGTLWAWGNDGNGVLGDGTTVDKSSPVSVIGGFTDWSQVSMGTSQTSALRTCQVYL